MYNNNNTNNEKQTNSISFESFNSIFDALEFACDKHQFQKRKNQLQTPYINHPIGVCSLLIKSGINDEIILKAALLHDTIEDTDTSYEELVQKFGYEVADVVLEVSDDGSLPKLERKKLQILNAPKLSLKAKHVRLADKLYNLQDICKEVPVGWDVQRVKEYFLWAKQVIEGCKGTNPFIEEKLNELYLNGQFHLEGSNYKCFEN